MTFAQPFFLYGLILLVVLFIFLIWANRRRKAALVRLGDPTLTGTLSQSLNRRGRNWKSILSFLGLALMMIALARPQWGSEVQMVEQKGLQVMVALDVSPSMLAEDIKPNRLSRAKMEIVDLMKHLGGDEIGLVLFSGASFIQFPLTNDYATAQNFVQSANPNLISKPGTAIGAALQMATNGFDPKRASQKVIVLITDGEDHQPDTLEMAKKAADAGVKIFAIGFGSPQGAPIPAGDAQSNASGFLKDNKGEVVLSKLDELTLQKIAQTGNGGYYRASAGGEEITALLGALSTMQRENLTSQFETTGIERFQIFLSIALLALILINLIPERTRMIWQHLFSPTFKSLILFALLLPFVLSACSASPQRLNNEGNEAYQRKDYPAALEKYQRAQKDLPEKAEPSYNAGNTYYRQNNYEQAQQTLLQSLQKANDSEPKNPTHQSLAGNAFHNLGNTFYNTNRFSEAIEAYKESLRLNPKDMDTKYNLELALQKQQEKEQQQKQQQDQQKDQNQKQQEQKQDQQNKNDQKQPEPSQQPNEQKAQQPDGQQPKQLTADQARQLLESAAQDSKSLQEYLQQLFLSPDTSSGENW